MSTGDVVEKKSWFYRALPALTLMLVAPLVAEILPGATRFSSAFVYPIEVLIWGGGAVMARFLVRKYRLGWFNLLLLGVVLGLAEECLIQQTSLVPLFIRIKGVEYARAWDVNYLYLIWALIYEAVFVVLVPVTLCELIFPSRKDNGWLSGWGIGIICVLFLPASHIAWFGWNVAVRKAMHLAPYNVPPVQLVAAAIAIAVLLALAVGPFRRALAGPARPMTPPHPIVVTLAGIVFSVVMFGITIMAFGISPDISPAIPVAAALVLALVSLLTVPGWMAHAKWGRWHDVGLTYGAFVGNCSIMFLGFINPQTAPIDLWGKTVLDAIAALMLLWLLVKVARRA